MTIKVGEIGKEIIVNADFNLSGNTSLQLDFKNEKTEQSFSRTSPEVTAPNVDSPTIPGIGVLPAGTYWQYATMDGDFTEEGNPDENNYWCVQGYYIEGTVKKFIGDKGTITVVKGC